MATFVLVHGAWHGSWCWKRVRKRLQQAGHDVFTPTLTGVADRCHLASPEVNLSTHIADVLNLIHWEELSEVILCGHSYGGFVISGVADRIPERMRGLVYVDAFVPEDGECVLDLVPPEMAASLRCQAAASGEGWKVDPIPGEVFEVNVADRPWMNAQCTPHPLASLKEPIRLSGEFARMHNATHILATGFREGSAFPAAQARAKKLGWKTINMACGHDVMLDLPEELTSALLDCAASD